MSLSQERTPHTECYINDHGVVLLDVSPTPSSVSLELSHVGLVKLYRQTLKSEGLCYNMYQAYHQGYLA